MFKIANVGGFAENYAAKCLDSFIRQDLPDWDMQVIVDPVGDKTPEKTMPFACDKIRIKINETRQYALHNMVEAIELLNPADDDIIIPMDLDDWLAHDEVFKIVNDKYIANPNLLLTYGNLVEYPETREKTVCESYTEQDFQGNFRKVHWKCRSLKTFKYKLWKHVKDIDLRDMYGDYFRVTWDLAMFWPMLEMAGPHRIQNIQDILYVYNKESPHNDDKVHIRDQMYNTDYLAARKSYKYLENF